MSKINKKNIAKCFISYSQADVPKEAVDHIVNDLRKTANGDIIFFYDRDNEAGTEIKEFMDNINSCDSVVIICSPDYKKKIEQDGEYIQYEFSLIKNKYDIYLKEKANPESEHISEVYFSIFPIIVSTYENKIKKEDAYPNYLKKNNIIYKRYTYASTQLRSEIRNIKKYNLNPKNLSEHKKKIFEYSKQIRKNDEDNKKIIKKIVSSTLTINLSRPITCESRDERISKLIKYTKAEITGNLGPVFCRTNFYNELILQTKKVFIGRKGSGKSQTILQYISEQHGKYKGVINIDANNINIFSLYEQIKNAHLLKSYEDVINNNYSEKFNFDYGTKKDISDFFSYEQLLRYTWYGYIYLYCIYTIAADFKQGNLSSNQSSNFRKAYSFINRLLDKVSRDDRWKNKAEISSSLYDYAFYKAIDFYEKIINESRNYDVAQTFADIRAANSLHNYLISLLTLNTYKSFTKTLKNCTKKIFLCLDGFDNIQEEQRGNRFNFSKETDIVLITEFETIWLTSLIEVIYQINIKKSDSDNSLLSHNLDICLMVPYDRLMQASYRKRDGFVYRELTASVNYKGLDLCNLFTRRIQIIADVNIKENQNNSDNIIAALEEVLGKFPNLNKNISVSLQNGQIIDFPLFLYLLRYSFWRPRDIIDHIEAIFKTVINGESLKSTINQDMIIESMVMSTDKIVMKTIEEFKDLWINVEDSLDKICFQDIVMKYSDFQKFLSDKNFFIHLSNGNILSESKDIIEFLYQIGFIGIILSNNYKKYKHLNDNQHQIFYSGSQVINGIGDEAFNENSIFFNPVFHFKYHLNISTNEILGIYTWNDLIRRDTKIENNIY